MQSGVTEIIKGTGDAFPHKSMCMSGYILDYDPFLILTFGLGFR